MSKVENLEAKRAKTAFEFTQTGNAKTEINYSAAVRELPSMIRMNGLRAAMAYFYSKGGQHKEVFQNVMDWFKAEDEPTKIMSAKFKESTDKKTEARFMEILLELTDDEYRIVQAETLTLANWMIRFVKEESTSKTESDAEPQI
jgi:CRISPR type III-B/RAMP module-associated protein Cmr5